MLQILKNGPLLVGDDFLKQRYPDSVPENDCDIECISTDLTPDYSALTKELRSLNNEYEGNRTAVDGIVASLLHKHIRIDRRTAAIPELWHYLSIVKYPGFVSWRHYSEKKEGTSKSRYLGGWERNAFGRLWWWAEFTYDPDLPDPYSRTKKGAESQEFMLHTIDNLCGGNRTLIAELIDFGFNRDKRLPDNIIRNMFVRINAMLVSLAIDTLDRDDTSNIVSSIYKAVIATK